MRAASLALMIGCSTAAATEPRAPKDPTLVLAVMDGVRADRTSLCGARRPTTPYLAELGAKKRVSFTCGAHAPAVVSRTSHASLFTGKLVHEHRYDSEVLPDWTHIPTLAEQLQARGYQTIMVSASPVIGRDPLLTKGFEIVRVAEKDTLWRGQRIPEEVAKALATSDSERPVFVYVHIADAYPPFGAIEEGLEWVPKRAALDLNIDDPEQAQPIHRMLDGRMQPALREKLTKVMRDVYDHALSVADATLEASLKVIEDARAHPRGLRLVVTSSHGTALGEHHQVLSGGSVWQPATHVPFLYKDSSKPELTPLRRYAFSIMHALDLLRDGNLPERARPPVSFSRAEDHPLGAGEDMVALWTVDNQKLVYDQGLKMRFDLAKDPEEQSPLQPWKNPKIATLLEHVAAYHAHMRWRDEQLLRQADQDAVVPPIDWHDDGWDD